MTSTPKIQLGAERKEAASMRQLAVSRSLGGGGEPKKEKRRDQANANALLTKSRQPQSCGTAAPPPPPATTWSNWVAEIYDDAELLILHSANPHKCHRQWPPCHRVKTTGFALWAHLWVTPQKAEGILQPSKEEVILLSTASEPEKPLTSLKFVNLLVIPL